MKTSLFNVILRQTAPYWRGIFEGPGTMLGLLHKATWLVFDCLSKEYCISGYLLAKEVEAQVRFVIHRIIPKAVFFCTDEGICR